VTYRYNNGGDDNKNKKIMMICFVLLLNFNSPSFAVYVQTIITNILIFLSLFYSFLLWLWMFLPPWKSQNICTVRNVIFLWLRKTRDMSQNKFCGTPGLSSLKLIKLWHIRSVNIYEQSDPYVHCNINLSNSSMDLKQLSTFNVQLNIWSKNWQL
jgi:hypothetical protein